MLAASLSQNSFAALLLSGCAAEARASPARIAPGQARAGTSGVNPALPRSPNGSYTHTRPRPRRYGAVAS
jgi:hypothetical protein